MAELNGVPATVADLEALALINYGHFTTMLVQDGRIRGLSDHCDRLVRDCRRLFACPLDPDLIRDYLRRAISGRDGVFLVRITVFDPAATLIEPGRTPSVLITTRPAGPLPAPPLRVRTVAGRRDLPEVKHVGTFGVLWGRQQARRDGYDDALFTEARTLIDAGTISEGATWNIGFVDRDRVIWPDAAVLPGVTMRLLQRAEPECVVRPVELAELPGMAAAFATSSGFGVRPIAAINEHEFPTEHPVLTRLARAYREIPGEAP